jgi:2-C-methyl-D-erythritol 4-phosphate cytidylyltransferase/2-C-methyl-D-erythritol 2,4-cyclodiphosphate synthase
LSADPARPAFDVVIVAAGSSSRMGGLDKLEAPLLGRPLLAWTVAAFASLPETRSIVVVTAPERVERYRGSPWLPAGVAEVVSGGGRRQESVAAGVRAVAEAARRDGRPTDDAIVLIHDGARPAITSSLIRAVAAATAEMGAVIPVVPVAETIKEMAGDVVGRTVDRVNLAAAQTPQGFPLGLLERAYALQPPESGPTWTDEAALLEACTITVHAISGDPGNLKVTLPGDLARAERLLRGADSARSAGPDRRVGFGSDTHAFGPGRPLALGGVEFADAPRLHGHSDGDVALHAVADALLGAAGLPDLGRLFPADDSTPKGVASGRLLTAVVARLADAGLRPTSIDLTIVGARPRLGDRLDEIRSAIAGLVGLQSVAVSVKASTGNLAGPEGAGRAMSAQAIATVGPVDGVGPAPVQ